MRHSGFLESRLFEMFSLERDGLYIIQTDKRAGNGGGLNYSREPKSNLFSVKSVFRVLFTLSRYISTLGISEEIVLQEF